eukprot:2861352-Rhodomonas_salina.1
MRGRGCRNEGRRKGGGREEEGRRKGGGRRKSGSATGSGPRPMRRVTSLSEPRSMNSVRISTEFLSAKYSVP